MEKNKKNAVLVTLADKNYINQAKALFSSAYWNSGWQGDYLLLAHEIPDKDLAWFRKKGILIYKCKPLVKEKEILRKDCMKSKAVLDKFYLFTRYFKRWKNIVFLDADIIVKTSLNELTNIKGFGAVEDIISLREQFLKKIKRKHIKEYAELKTKYNLNSPSFNSGVFSFSSDIIKANQLKNLTSLFIEYSNLQDTYSGEQIALNLLFYKKWIKLKKVYNLFSSDIPRFCIFPPNKLFGVLHFVYHKPWITRAYFYLEYLSNLQRAQELNLNVKQTPVYLKNQFDIERYNAMLEEQSKDFYINSKLKTLLFIDKTLGKIGIILKQVSPRVYNKLKSYYIAI